MSWRVVEISTPGTYISKIRGSLCIKSPTGEESLLSLSDVHSLMISNDGVAISSAVISALGEEGAMILFVNNKYEPSSILFSIKSSIYIRKRLLKQIELSIPSKKKIWANVVVEKIKNQAQCLQMCSRNNDKLELLAGRVRSGDPDNVEAQAAREYFESLFDDFKRSDPSLGLNSMLNYGYSIIRSAVARALCASGLNLSLGIHHHNLENDFCLVDDIVEPYRPFVDHVVVKIKKPETSAFELTTAMKKELASVLSIEVEFDEKKTSLSNAILLTAQSFCQFLDGETDKLKFARFIQ